MDEISMQRWCDLLALAGELRRLGHRRGELAYMMASPLKDHNAGMFVYEGTVAAPIVTRKWSCTVDEARRVVGAAETAEYLRTTIPQFDSRDIELILERTINAGWSR